MLYYKSCESSQHLNGRNKEEKKTTSNLDTTGNIINRLEKLMEEINEGKKKRSKM